MKSFLSYFDFKAKMNKGNKQDKISFILIFIFALGMILSIVIVGTSANNKDGTLYSLFSQSIEKNISSDVLSLFISSIISNTSWLLFAYFLGVSAFGYPFVFIIPFVMGIQKGSLLSFLLVSRGIKYYFKLIMLFVLHNSILIVLLISAFCFSIKMSSQTFFMVRGISRFDVDYIEFKKYNKVFVVFMFLILLLSIADAFLINLL